MDPHDSKSVAIERWRLGLLHLIGCSAAEIDERLEVLSRFCADQHVSPEDLIRQCRHGANRIARSAYYLRAARDTGASLIVQSFLVHNGINVFGELACMPATADVIVAEQGKQWRRDGG